MEVGSASLAPQSSSGYRAYSHVRKHKYWLEANIFKESHNYLFLLWSFHVQMLLQMTKASIIWATHIQTQTLQKGQPPVSCHPSDVVGSPWNIIRPRCHFVHGKILPQRLASNQLHDLLRWDDHVSHSELLFCFLNICLSVFPFSSLLPCCDLCTPAPSPST